MGLVAVIAISSLALLGSTVARGETFLLPADESDSLVGELRTIPALQTDTLVDIAREFDLGYYQIAKANPAVNRWLPREGTRIVLPSQYILPPGPRDGIVINLAEYRLYYYPSNSRTVSTYPISIGRYEWPTPRGEMKVVKKQRNPPWHPPQSIRDEALFDEGDALPKVIPGGAPHNPLGAYALRLSAPQYLIHGVDERKEYSIGMRVTHGCIRLYPEDIEELFHDVPIGTPVRIINHPVKAGWSFGTLYLEVHRELMLDDAPLPTDVSLDDLFDVLHAQEPQPIHFDMRAIRESYAKGDGIPRPVSRIPKRPSTWQTPQSGFRESFTRLPQVSSETR